MELALCDETEQEYCDMICPYRGKEFCSSRGIWYRCKYADIPKKDEEKDEA